MIIGPTPTKVRFLEDSGLDGINVPFSICHLPTEGCISPTVLFWALQVLWYFYQCRWFRRPAGSLAQLSPGEVELWELLSNSVHCVAEAARRQLEQSERSKLWRVPRFANLVAMFGQFVETPCFFSIVKGHCQGCFFDNIWQRWKAKNVK